VSEEEITRGRTRVVLVGILGLAVFQAGSTWFPSGSLGHYLWVDLGWVVGDAIAAYFCFAAARAMKTRSLRMAWTCISIAMALWTLGASSWAWDELVLGRVAPFPSATDLFGWGGAGFALAGVFFYRVEKVSAAVTLRQLADLGLLASSLIGLAIELLHPEVMASERPVSHIVAALFTPSMALLCVCYGLLALWQRALGKRRKVLVLVLLGLATLAVVAASYIAAVVGGKYGVGHWTDSLWLVAMLLVAWAAHEELWLVGDESPREARETRLDAYVPAVSAAIWLFVVVRFGSVHAEELKVVRGVVSAIVLGLMMLRVWANHRISLELQQRVAAEEARRWRLEAQLVRAHKLEALGTLAGGVAHDFNNALAAATVTLHGARRKIARGADPSNDLLEAERVLRRATGLTERLLGLAHQRSVRRKTVDVGDMVGQVAGLLSRVLPPGVRVSQEIAADLPLIQVDPTGLEHALLNLGLNARDALRERGGTITLRAVPGPREGELIVEVSDDGPGIPADVLPHVFEAFFTTKPEGEGSGLGLAMVQAFVAANNGAIDVASAPGDGACFRLSFTPDGDEAARSRN
jgi:signal transduction histidine kinase